MVEETLIEGLIYHGPGCCPVCSGPLVVADNEITIMDLKQDGTPFTDETIVRCEAICTHCGHKQRMCRWKGGYIPYGRSALILKTMELRDEYEARVKEINANAKGTNPFA